MNNNIMKLVIFIFLVVLYLNLISAQSTLGDVPLNNCIKLKQSCGNCTYSNITAITYPDKTTINISYSMTKQDTMYYYDFCNNTKLGQYIIDGISDVDGIVTPWSYDYEVISGSPWIWITLILLAIIFLIISIFADEEFFVYISGIFFLIAGIYTMINGIDIMTIEDLYIKAITYIFIGLGFLLTIGAYVFNRFSSNKKEEEFE